MHENWMLGWIDAPIEQSLGWKTCPRVRWIGARSSRRYLADPFGWPGQPHTILCEEYDFTTRRGRIKRLELDGTVITHETPVEFPLSGHLSYPFLFERNGDIYCLPESSAARQLMLLRWEGESSGWKPFSTPLPNVAAADSTLFEHNGYFWIAYTDTAMDRFDNLNVCYAESLSGPWRLHPQNPVKRDARSSRGGGTPFRVDGSLYRPAQDCGVRYGGAIRILQIVECSPTAFAEKEITVIKPAAGKNPHGFHTLSAWGDKCLIDAKRMRVSPAQVLAKVWRRLNSSL